MFHLTIMRQPSSLQKSIRCLSTVNSRAQTGFGKGTNELYDRARPSYQPEALSRIRDAVGSLSSLNIVEVAAGSGIFTRAILAHPAWSSSIRWLRAIEPSEGMREIFSNTIKDRRVTVSDGVFERTAVEDGWADLVVIAQALHWAPDFEVAMAENARITRPGSVLACIWNLDDRKEARWLAQVRAVIKQYGDGTPQAIHNHWQKAFETPSYVKFFDPPEEEVFSYKLSSRLDKVTNHILSASFIAVLPDDERAKVRMNIEDIIRRGDDKIWIDKSEGTFEYPLKTILVISGRK